MTLPFIFKNFYWKNSPKFQTRIIQINILMLKFQLQSLGRDAQEVQEKIDSLVNLVDRTKKVCYIDLILSIFTLKIFNLYHIKCFIIIYNNIL